MIWVSGVRVGLVYNKRHEAVGFCSSISDPPPTSWLTGSRLQPNDRDLSCTATSVSPLLYRHAAESEG